MKSSRLILCTFFFLPLVTVSASDEKPARDILGIRLSMRTNDIHARLQELGKLVRKEAGHQEVWTVRDPSYSNILLGFTKEGQLRYITAVAGKEKEVKRVRYAEIGDLEKARKAGDPKINVFNYQWTLPADKGEPETLVVALGRDPDYLSSSSLKRLGGTAGEDND